MTNTSALRSSESNEWYTPARYIEAARTVMGGIDLDPASCESANRTVQAARYYTAADDGMAKRWSGRVWLNPPYSKQRGKSNQGRWSAKLRAEYCAGHIDQAVLLVNASTGNRWFAPLWDYVLCFPDHRIRFVSPTGEGNSPTHSNAFVYFGSNVDAFDLTFSRFGHIVSGKAVARHIMMQGALL